jgi:hypothetical protein
VWIRLREQSSNIGTAVAAAKANIYCAIAASTNWGSYSDSSMTPKAKSADRKCSRLPRYAFTANKMMVAVVLIAAVLAVIYTMRHRFAISEIATPHKSFASSTVEAILPTESRDTNVANIAGTPSAATVIIHDVKRDSEISSGLTLAPSTDQSVVGRPFEISESVINGCKAIVIEECRVVMASVAKMAAEPRDTQWAKKMEERLQTAADMEGGGKYLIRNLECRTSTCIVEVVLRDPGPFPRYQDFISSALRPHAAVTGTPEYGPLGERYRVELMDFARR